MKFTKKRSQNKQAEQKRDATWKKFKTQQNTLAANKRGDRLHGSRKVNY
ncbi:hypothetical protein IWT140_00759 [Secundilactobacillus pentosiphilus]|uniref:Uncharacterized protein n=1 Tax=Secundilactobacillus pentosiphilus TaxID=1714682 RepID=A0A1Z5IN30_9LACO|nr:hypothetical protein [Secundilactobacillus pentosiphilus]GAX03159.1 hypothetical protein IWT140_00759 [Secundilactobacillus pentosiphilus]GAX06699.1 hypothetical protein IWT25_02046 [Secundilactobacillus pentosiphilus]